MISILIERGNLGTERDTQTEGRLREDTERERLWR